MYRGGAQRWPANRAGPFPARLPVFFCCSATCSQVRLLTGEFAPHRLVMVGAWRSTSLRVERRAREYLSGRSFLADELHVALVALEGLAAVPADARVLEVVLIDDGDGPLVHVLVPGRIEVG